MVALRRPAVAGLWRVGGIKPRQEYGALTRGLRKLRKRLLTSRSPGTRLRAHRAQRMGRGIQKGLRGSGVREEGWKVQGGRWKRGLKGGAEGLD